MEGFGLMSIYKSDWVRFRGKKKHQFSVDASLKNTDYNFISS